MSSQPHFDDWGFPPWLVCLCDDSSGFKTAKKVLIEKFGFVYSPFEEATPDYFKSLVLPRLDINLADIIERADLGGEFRFWGRGRVRFDEKNDQGPRYELKYWPGDCPWEFVKDNPLRGPAIELYKILNPQKFLNHRGEEILFPYNLASLTD